LAGPLPLIPAASAFSFSARSMSVSRYPSARATALPFSVAASRQEPSKAKRKALSNSPANGENLDLSSGLGLAASVTPMITETPSGGGALLRTANERLSVKLMPPR